MKILFNYLQQGSDGQHDEPTEQQLCALSEACTVDAKVAKPQSINAAARRMFFMIKTSIKM